MYKIGDDDKASDVYVNTTRGVTSEGVGVFQL